MLKGRGSTFSLDQRVLAFLLLGNLGIGMKRRLQVIPVSCILCSEADGRICKRRRAVIAAPHFRILRGDLLKK